MINSSGLSLNCSKTVFSIPFNIFIIVALVKQVSSTNFPIKSYFMEVISAETVSLLLSNFLNAVPSIKSCLEVILSYFRNS